MKEREHLTIGISSQIARSAVEPEDVVNIMATILKVYVNNKELRSDRAAGLLQHVADELRTNQAA